MRPADESDLAAIANLRESVGWAVHEWALRAVIGVPEALCLVAVDPDDGPVAVGSGIAYGRLGWVGNMVVAEAHRRRGVGAAILEAVIDFLTERGCARLELYATPDGRPLYERYGFTLTDPSAMIRVSRAKPSADPDVAVSDESDAAAIAAYDAPRFGGDRSRQLATMARDPERPLLAARVDGALAGYLWLRADGPRVGPFIADAPRVASALLAAAFERAPAAEELTMNMPTANEPGTAWLRELGVEVEPWDGRMARGPRIPRRDDTIYSNTVGALG
jgi:GNAT superfamily N-acetyltransferase